MIRKPAPDEVLALVSCNCKKAGCNSRSCLCKEHGLLCTDICNCNSCTNGCTDSDNDNFPDDDEFYV